MTSVRLFAQARVAVDPRRTGSDTSASAASASSTDETQTASSSSAHAAPPPSARDDNRRTASFRRPRAAARVHRRPPPTLVKMARRGRAHKLDQRRRVRVVNRTPRAGPQRAPQVPSSSCGGSSASSSPNKRPSGVAPHGSSAQPRRRRLAYHDTNKRPRLLGVVAVRAPAPDLGSQHQHVARALRVVLPERRLIWSSRDASALVIT